jgi:hypothetical protein
LPLCQQILLPNLISVGGDLIITGIDTSTAGQHTLSCTARDNAGNVATASVTYNVGTSSPCPPQRLHSERCKQDDRDGDDHERHGFWGEWWRRAQGGGDSADRSGDRR